MKSAAEAINSLKDIIKKKDDEIKTQEEKYKRFLGKAKQVRFVEEKYKRFLGFVVIVWRG